MDREEFRDFEKNVLTPFFVASIKLLTKINEGYDKKPTLDIDEVKTIRENIDLVIRLGGLT